MHLSLPQSSSSGVGHTCGGQLSLLVSRHEVEGAASVQETNVATARTMAMRKDEALNIIYGIMSVLCVNRGWVGECILNGRGEMQHDDFGSLHLMAPKLKWKPKKKLRFVRLAERMARQAGVKRVKKHARAANGQYALFVCVFGGDAALAYICSKRIVNCPESFSSILILRQPVGWRILSERS